DPKLPKSDPAGEPLEEAIALGELPERRRRARRKQAEIAGVLRNLLASAPVDERVECFDAEAAQRRLPLAVGLGGEHHIVAIVHPMADKPLEQSRGMLAVAIHEQHAAEARVVETGKERRLLAEIAR